MYGILLDRDVGRDRKKDVEGLRPIPKTIQKGKCLLIYLYKIKILKEDANFYAILKMPLCPFGWTWKICGQRTRAPFAHVRNTSCL